MHFLGKTHVWILVLYYRCTIAQLSEIVGNCTIIFRFEDSTLDHGRGIFTTTAVNSTSTIK